MTETLSPDIHDPMVLHGRVLKLFRNHGVDFDPTHVGPDGVTDTPVIVAERLLEVGALAPEAIKQLGELGIGV